MKGVFSPIMSWASDNGFYEPFLGGKEVEAQVVGASYGFVDVCLLLLTICFEVSGTLLLKRGSTQYWSLVPAYILYFTGLSLFTYVLKKMPLAIAYTTWCSLGTIGVTIVCVVVYDEILSWAKIFCIGGTIPFVVGLYLLP